MKSNFHPENQAEDLTKLSLKYEYEPNEKLQYERETPLLTTCYNESDDDYRCEIAEYDVS